MIATKRSRLERFYSMYESEVTKRNYKNMLEVYFRLIYESGTLEEKAEKYFAEERDFEEDVRNYFSTILTRPPKSVEVMMSMCKTFLADNDVEFPSRFWKELRRKKKGHGAVTRDKIPTQEELRRILLQLPLNGKAFYLTLISSGMRVGETLKLMQNDIDLNSNPCIIHIRAENTKSGNQRITFISNEAKETILEWLKQRPAFLKHYSKADDGRLFPLDYENVKKQWAKALTKTGLTEQDERTGWNLLHIHTLRKFFRTKLASAAPVDVVEILIGHQSYLNSSYVRYSEAQLAEFYSKAVQTVTVYGNVSYANKDFEVIKLENAKMRVELNELQSLKVSFEKFQQNYGEMIHLLGKYKGDSAGFVNEYVFNQEPASEVTQ